MLSTIRDGLKLDFLSIPPFAGIQETHVNAKSLPIILQEVEKLLKKGPIEIVPWQDTKVLTQHFS